MALAVNVRDVHSKCHRNEQANIFIGGQQDVTRSLTPHMAPQYQVEVSTVEMPSTLDCGVLDPCEMTWPVHAPCIVHSTRPRIMPGGTKQNSRNHLLEPIFLGTDFERRLSRGSVK